MQYFLGIPIPPGTTVLVKRPLICWGLLIHYPPPVTPMVAYSSALALINLKFLQFDLDITVNNNQGLSNRDIKKIKMLYNYVSRNRTKPLNETRKSNNNAVDVVDDDLPRAKPNRYLGLPDPITTTIKTTTTPVPMTIDYRRRRNRRGRHFRRRRPEFMDDMLLLLK